MNSLRTENVYLIVCLLLLVLQVFQRYEINKLKKDVNTLANHVLLQFYMSLKSKEDEEKK